MIIQNVTIAAFAILSYTGPQLPVFGAVMAADNFGAAFAGVALVTYMSSLTSLGYTATQYALLSSAYAYLGKFTKGFSGVMVEWLASGRTLLEGYALFFIGAGLLGIPALILCIVLARITQQRATAAVSDTEESPPRLIGLLSSSPFPPFLPCPALSGLDMMACSRPLPGPEW